MKIGILVLFALSVCVTAWFVIFFESPAFNLSKAEDVILGHLSRIPGQEVPLTYDEVEMERTLQIHKPLVLINRKSEGRVPFEVFAMYWTDSRVKPKEASRHVPDICFRWGGGMEILSRAEIQVGPHLPQANYREFLINDQKIFTLYWHFIDDQWVDYAAIGRGRTAAFYAQNFLKFFGSYRNMIYLRIVSSKPYEELLTEAAFSETLKQLEQVWLQMNLDAQG